jgi:hypothetical protein
VLFCDLGCRLHTRGATADDDDSMAGLDIRDGVPGRLRPVRVREQVGELLSPGNADRRDTANRVDERVVALDVRAGLGGDIDQLLACGTRRHSNSRRAQCCAPVYG